MVGRAAVNGAWALAHTPEALQYARGVPEEQEGSESGQHRARTGGLTLPGSTGQGHPGDKPRTFSAL